MTNCFDKCNNVCMDDCNNNCRIDPCVNSCKDTCQSKCFGCTGSCDTHCDNACRATNMDNMTNMFKTRRYGIVYTQDYTDLIALLVLELSRREINPTGQYAAYLKDEYPNRSEVISYIIGNMTHLGYTGNATVGVVTADQMNQIQLKLAQSALEIVRTTKGPQIHIPIKIPPKPPTPSEITFAGSRWTTIHELKGSDNIDYLIIRKNDPINLRYHSGSFGHWPSSELRSYLENTYYNSLPDAERKRIIPVKNTTSYANASYLQGKCAEGVETTTDRIWLESYTNIMGTSWVGANHGAATCNETTTITNIMISGRFNYYTKNNGNIGTGTFRRLRSTGGIAWNMACPASGKSINVGHHGDFFGTTAYGACYPCICIKKP